MFVCLFVCRMGRSRGWLGELADVSSSGRCGQSDRTTAGVCVCVYVLVCVLVALGKKDPPS